MMYGHCVVEELTASTELLDLELPHITLKALAWGPRDGRLALLLHGYPDSAHSWRFLGPMLAAEGYRVVAPFTRGYHPSPLPADGDYHVGALMYDVLAIHAHLGAPDDAVLIGHDWGAWTTNALAAYPKSPFAAHIAMAMPPIAAVAAGGGGAIRQLALVLRQLRRSWYVIFQQVPWLPERVLHRVIPRLWKDWSPGTADVRTDVVITLAAVPTVAHRAAAVGYYRANFRPPRPSPAYADLHRYYRELPHHPIMLMYGDEDGAVLGEYFRDAESALPAHSRLQVIRGGGHFLQVDTPDPVFDAIVDYLDSRR